MQSISFGKVTVAVAGTRVNLGTAAAALVAAGTIVLPKDHKIAAIIVSQTASTGNVVFGTSAVVASTLVGAIKEFVPPAATGLRDTYIHSNDCCGGDPMFLDDYAIDVGSNNDGAIISVLIN